MSRVVGPLARTTEMGMAANTIMAAIQRFGGPPLYNAAFSRIFGTKNFQIKNN